MNFTDVIRSFVLGLGIGVVLQFADPGAADLAQRAVTVLASGAIGLLIGLVTEWLTSLLPSRIARTGTYFLINSVLAVVITAFAMVAIVVVAGADDWWPIVVVVVAIVVFANLIDAVRLRRVQRRLRAVQARLRASSSGHAEGGQER